jgi:DNA-directed RNA polymerase III subunit RPC4
MPKLYSLPNVDEGLVGKIVRHRSGKIKFLLGDAVYNIERGVSSEFQQNVVIIDPRIDERSTNIYNLGPIKAKYVCSPDWKWLFEKISE